MKNGSREDTAERSAAGEDTLSFLGVLWALEHALQTGSKRMAHRLGVTGTQRFTVRMLGRNPGLGAGELAELLHDHPSTLTGVIQRLVEHGLVERRTDPEDRRRVLLDLTDQGREVDALREGTIESAVGSALQSLPPEHVRVAREVLQAVIGALEGLPR
jgi:DNA-binding MarR family transcriptional regulator